MSDNVVNAADEFERRKTVARFARLLGLVEAQEAAVLADPLTHLREMAARFEQLLAAVDEAVKDLDGRMSSAWEDGGDPILSPEGVAIKRNRSARAGLDAARTAARTPMKHPST